MLITPFGKKILIDGGEGNSEKYDYGKNVLFPYLLDRKIKTIDYLVVSHCDSDHVGGLIYIAQNMKVKDIFLGAQFEDSEQLQKLIYIAKSKKIKVHILQKGDEIYIEKNVKFEVIWPNTKNAIKENVLNNNSLVLKLNYKNFTMLFTGDIEKLAEDEIVKEYKNINMNIDILKVAHHGSKTSSSEKFIEMVMPKVVVIGVGKDNNFGHPSTDVLKRYENISSKIYRTDLNGEISIKVNNKGEYKIKTTIKNNKN